MTSKSFLTLGTSALVFGMLAFQGCFVEEPRHVAPAYGYPAYGYTAPAPAYVAPAPAVVVRGDYDEHHAWHERDWWVSNRPNWVHDHHPEWLAKEHHEEHEYR